MGQLIHFFSAKPPFKTFIFDLRPFVLCIFVASAFLGCQSNNEKKQSEQENYEKGLVEVLATDYAFTAPDSILSGWNTFRMVNKGSEHHLFVLIKLPPDKSYGDYKQNIILKADTVKSVIEKGLKNGTIDSGSISKIIKHSFPDWYWNAELGGGISLTAPNKIAETSFHLEPGKYVMECYALVADSSISHTDLGMMRPLFVKTDSTNGQPPQAGERVTISKLNIKADSILSPGEQTIAVNFGEKQKGSLFKDIFQHLHIARLDDNTDIEDLSEWMKLDPELPSPVTFIGGAQDMPTGKTAYVHVNLKPGHYAWVLSGPPENGTVQAFTVE